MSEESRKKWHVGDDGLPRVCEAEEGKCPKLKGEMSFHGTFEEVEEWTSDYFNKTHGALATLSKEPAWALGVDPKSRREAIDFVAEKGETATSSELLDMWNQVLNSIPENDVDNLGLFAEKYNTDFDTYYNLDEDSPEKRAIEDPIIRLARHENDRVSYLALSNVVADSIDVIDNYSETQMSLKEDIVRDYTHRLNDVSSSHMGDSASARMMILQLKDRLNRISEVGLDEKTSGVLYDEYINKLDIRDSRRGDAVENLILGPSEMGSELMYSVTVSDLLDRHSTIHQKTEMLEQMIAKNPYSFPISAQRAILASSSTESFNRVLGATSYHASILSYITKQNSESEAGRLASQRYKKLEKEGRLRP